ncbi:uncharacterized protein LOC143925185 [Lithobates pipiens]
MKISNTPKLNILYVFLISGQKKKIRSKKLQRQRHIKKQLEEITSDHKIAHGDISGAHEQRIQEEQESNLSEIEQEDGEEEGILENVEDRTNGQAYVLEEDSGVIILEDLSYPVESPKGNISNLQDSRQDSNSDRCDPERTDLVEDNSNIHFDTAVEWKSIVDFASASDLTLDSTTLGMMSNELLHCCAEEDMILIVGKCFSY